MFIRLKKNCFLIKIAMVTVHIITDKLDAKNPETLLE